MRYSKRYDDFGIKGVDESGADEQAVSCPECSRSRKKKRARCLSVNLSKACWICHHCGWIGTLKEGGRYSDPHYQKPDYRKPKLLAVNPDIAAPIMKWFNRRGITNQVQMRNKITVADVWMPQVEAKVECVGFPYFREGEHINTKWRSNKKHFRLEAGAELVPYGLDDIKDADTVIWVEGELDKLSVEEAGYINCISPPNGAPTPNSKTYTSHFDWLTNAEKYLAGKKHILFVDADKAGVRLQDELARRLGRENCTRCKLPDGYKDANEYLIAFGADSLKEVIENAKPFPVAGIHEAKSLVSGVMQLHDEGIKSGVKTGWQIVNYHYTVRPGEITIVTGIPNHGKSYFLDCLTLNIAKAEGWRFGVFSPENQPLERHAAGYVEKALEQDFNSLSAQDIESMMVWLQDHYYWILPDITDDWSLDGILDKAKALVYRYGISGLIIDPWNEISHVRPQGMNETDYISLALTKIRQFARLHNVHVWVVAHPSKLLKDRQTNEYPVPTPYDISGSAHWRNKADNCITVHREFAKGKERQVTIYIQKVRFKEIGCVGSASLIFDIDKCNYRERSALDKD